MKKILFGFWLFLYTAIAFAGVVVQPANLSRLTAVNTSSGTVSSNSIVSAGAWTQTRLDGPGSFVAATGVYTAAVTGYYQVTLAARYVSATLAAGAQNICIINVNGTALVQATTPSGITGSGIPSCFVSAPVYVTAGQTIQPQLFQLNGVTLTLDATANDTFFSIMQLP